MQISWKQTLGLVAALSAMSCGDSEPTGDTFQGYIDGSVLDTRFQPAGTCGSNIKCYVPQTATVNGDPVVFYNMGLVANPNTDKSKPPAPTKVESIATTVYEFPEGCIAGPEYDPRTDAYEQTRQYPVYSRLPVTSTSSPPVPLAKVVYWSGSDKYECNAIKSATSVDEGKFSLTQQEGSVISMRAIIAPFEMRRGDGTTYTPPLGWYKGLLLNYVDAGQVPVETVQDNPESEPYQVLAPMDGVLVHPSGTGTSQATANNVLVLRARPGEQGWSPVVKLREFRATAPNSPSFYKSLCYDPPCATNAVDMTKATTYAGTLYLTTGAP
ncbi:hypothetical protein [Hyalangium gracile]|uniref:hypothetical protein n=1 Tax=Hyalangium gracile TaxID=394092 RepID=UPI001CCA416A|nr:hypothetical protein [Hyalangium gracile]